MQVNQKYFGGNNMQSNKIEDLITPDETVLWDSVPKKSAYILASILKMLPIVIIWLLFDGAFIWTMVSFMDEVPWFLWVFFALHLAPVWLWISNIVRSVAEIKNIRYVITDKRIIIRSGVIVDLKFMYFTDIINVRVRVGVIDRMLKVGDIYITAEKQTAVLYDITDPYGVANELQRIVRDIKADTYYPNAFRPDENPGYGTKYTGNGK